MSNKHVLIYCPVFLPEVSGYTNAFKQLILNLLNNGFEVDVLTPQPLSKHEEESLTHPNLCVYRYNPMLRVWGLGLFYQYYKQASFIKKLHKQRSYQLVFIETGDAPLLTFFLPKSILNKTAIRFHSTSDTEYLHLGKHKKYKLRRWFWKYLSGKKIQHLCATNAYHLNYAQHQVLQVLTVKTKHVITNTVDVTQQSLNTNSNPITFVMLGRMDEEGYKQKGFDLLLEALPLIQNDFLTTQARFIIIGDGKLYNDVAKHVATYPFVTLHRKLNHQQVNTLLQQADVVVLPSRYEGVAMFALEALANSNAVIFGNTGGLIDMVDGNGILVDTSSANNLANAILQMLHHPKLDALKQQSKMIAQQRFSAMVQYNQFIQLFNQINHG